MSLVLGTRYPARWVWAGVSAAFLVHVAIACAAGRLLTLAPRRLVEVVVAVLFAVAAFLLLRPEPERVPDAEVPLPPAPRLWPVLGTSFGFVFVGEWGDITQIATANLVARYDDVVSVALGAATGLLTAAALAVTAGQWIVRRVPLHLVRRCAGLVMAAFAVAALVAVLT